MESLGDWAVVAYRDVSNMKALLDALESGTLQGSSRCCILNAQAVPSKLPLAVAIQRLQIQRSMRTKSIGSELLLMLSPTKNIDTALRNFSCDNTHTSCVIALKQHTTESGGKKKTAAGGGSPSTNVAAELSAVDQLVKGKQVPLSTLPTLADTNTVAKIYNIPSSELQCTPLDAAVANRISTADI